MTFSAVTDQTFASIYTLITKVVGLEKVVYATQNQSSLGQNQSLRNSVLTSVGPLKVRNDQYFIDYHRPSACDYLLLAC